MGYGIAVLYFMASDQPAFDISGELASIVYTEHSPGGYSLVSKFVTQVVMTFFLLLIILGATDEKAIKGYAG